LYFHRLILKQIEAITAVYDTVLDAGHNVVAINSELLVNTASTILVTLAVVRNTAGS
jgi:hypothetical protein